MSAVMKKIFFTFIIIISGALSIYPQGFTPPSPGKAVIYFVRTKSYYYENIQYFDNNRYIGELNAKGFLRYECDTAQHLFWIFTSRENFVIAHLQEGRTYIVNYLVKGHGLGFISPIASMAVSYNQFNLIPLAPDYQELLNESKKVIQKNKPVVIPEKEISRINKEMKISIDSVLGHFNKNGKYKGRFLLLLPEMAIPLNALQ